MKIIWIGPKCVCKDVVEKSQIVETATKVQNNFDRLNSENSEDPCESSKS